jgi:maltose-binding protein MalE
MKKTLLACALGLTLLGTSCLGPNKTWNNLHDWNTKVTENKWGNEAVFLGLNIIPVYGLCYLADILIFNSIEFWDSGSKTAK